MDANPHAPLSLAAQLSRLVPAVAAYHAEQAETVRERRARGTGRPRDIDRGQQTRARIVAFIAKSGGARVAEIAKELKISPGNVSHHTTVLLANKVIQRRGEKMSHDGYELRRGNHA